MILDPKKLELEQCIAYTREYREYPAVGLVPFLCRRRIPDMMPDFHDPIRVRSAKRQKFGQMAQLCAGYGCAFVCSTFRSLFVQQRFGFVNYQVPEQYC